MSTPQGFTIIVIGSEGEYAATVATVLDPTHSGYSPDIRAVAIIAIRDQMLFSEGMKIGLHINDTLGIKWIDPKCVDLWLALDKEGETLARRMIKEKGPAPDTYYRRVFPDPVVQSCISLPMMYKNNSTCDWIREIEKLMIPWKKKIFDAFYESS